MNGRETTRGSKRAISIWLPLFCNRSLRCWFYYLCAICLWLFSSRSTFWKALLLLCVSMLDLTDNAVVNSCDAWKHRHVQRMILVIARRDPRLYPAGQGLGETRKRGTRMRSVKKSAREMKRGWLEAAPAFVRLRGLEYDVTIFMMAYDITITRLITEIEIVGLFDVFVGWICGCLAREHGTKSIVSLSRLRPCFHST